MPPFLVRGQISALKEVRYNKKTLSFPFLGLISAALSSVGF